jgi:RimJ/RimL family protein N-acetyltransferase
LTKALGGVIKRAVDVLRTDRLELLPITRALVDAVVDGRRDDAETICSAKFPDIWPGRALVERAFTCPLEKLREDPASWLWGARVLVSREENARRVVGSVVLDGRPNPNTRTVEVAYGIDGAFQGRGYATEGTRAVVEWALEQEEVLRVTASTFPWHVASLKVLRKIGMHEIGTRETEMFGDLVVYAREHS